jgi:hypothetical protein
MPRKITNYDKFKSEILERASLGLCFDCPARKGCPEAGHDQHEQGTENRCVQHFTAWANMEEV